MKAYIMSNTHYIVRSFKLLCLPWETAKLRHDKHCVGFSIPHIFYVPTDGVPLGIGYRHKGSKNDLSSLHYRDNTKSMVSVECEPI